MIEDYIEFDDPCSDCEDKFSKIFDIIYDDGGEFQWGVHKRKPQPEIDGHEHEMDWIMLPEGRKWLKQRFKKNFPGYNDDAEEEYCRQVYVTFY